MPISTKEFLSTVITAPEGYLLIAVGGNGHGWNENYFSYPSEIDSALDLAANYVPETNVYFSSYLFSEKNSTKDAVIPSRTIQADLDEADPLTLPIQPTILVQTSYGRYQGYWVLKDAASTMDAHEILSRKLTYSIPDCDHSGWPLGRKVRLPNTLNHKYLEGAQQVLVAQTSMRVYRESDLELLPDVSLIELEQYNEAFLDPDTHQVITDGPHELLESIRPLIPNKVYLQYDTNADDRSEALWALMCSCFRAGLTREKVFYLAKNTVNNKFKDLRFHQDRELAKDILRAEATIKTSTLDVRAMILKARTAKGPVSERRQMIFQICKDSMRDKGEFLKTQDERPWYIRRDLGRPVAITVRSELLHILLDIEFGLNHTETEHDYVLNSLIAWASNLPANAHQSTLSHYSTELASMLLHTGKKDVIRITAATVEHTTDGSYGIVFPWALGNDPFNPVLYEHDPTSAADWHTTMFANCLDNIVGISKAEAMAILRVWFIFLLFRSEALSRPILTLLGSPGSGKTTLFRRIYALLYGRQRSLDSITNPENYDAAVIRDPLVVLDNVDTWQNWLPDKLALAAGTSDIVKRKLWTDADTVIQKRQAMVGITAHNPKFGREDVADRLLIINFERLSHWIPEGDIIGEILTKRNWLWGGIVRDIQRVLGTPMVSHADMPQFRIEDFARIGMWIATALNIQDDFRSAVKNVQTSQKNFIIEEDSILVDALQAFIAKKLSVADDYMTAAQIWTHLSLATTDHTAFEKLYKNAVQLGKKLWAMQNSLKTLYNVEWKYDSVRGSRVWRFSPKDKE